MCPSVSRDSTALLCHQTLQQSFCLSFLFGLQIYLRTQMPALCPAWQLVAWHHTCSSPRLPESCFLLPASPDSESKKAILEVREETSPFGTRLLPNWLVPQILTTHILGLGGGHTDAGEAEATGQVWVWWWLSPEPLLSIKLENPRSLDSPTSSRSPQLLDFNLKPKHGD